MRVFDNLEQLPGFRNAVVTIGSFDGVHLGHQQLLARINRLARRVNGESVVITFHPHPRQVVYPRDHSMRLLTTIEEKIELFRHYQVDNVVVAPFSIEFSQLSADEYIHKFLVGKFRPTYLVIGYDHRFGLNRQGDINYLRWHGKACNYEVVEIEKQELDNLSISSTKIRQGLENGDVLLATRLLGHAYTLQGKVVKGQQLGGQLGFPTANLAVSDQHKLIPCDGIYAVRVLFEEVTYGGMLYIGSRPTLHGPQSRSIEVHIFDFNQNIYGRELRLELVDFIRHDLTLPSLEALRNQIQLDQEAVQARLLALPQPASAPAALLTAVVILNYNGASHLRRFLPSVLAHNEGHFQQIYVADNGSTDDSLAVLAHEFPTVRVLELGQNYGFAEGYNQALQQIDAEVYVLLNSDVEVTAGWLEPCLTWLANDPLTAACQPKIRAYAQRTHFEYAGGAGGWIDSLGYPFCRGRIFATTEPDEGQYDSPGELFWASGAALVVRADLFHAIGGFDGDYFAHAEEIDLCWRLKRAGYRIGFVPNSVVYHVGGGTLSYLTPRKAYLNFRNTLCTSFKNEPWPKLIWWLPLRLLMDGLAGALFLFQGKWAHIRAIVDAHWSFFPRMLYWWRKRLQDQKHVEMCRVGPDRTQEGRYRGSIVWQYYALGRKYFRDLPPNHLQIKP